jgi:hypothetical protein
MKRKLLAIGILALLLITMMPMAAAAPSPKIRDDVYWGINNDVLGPKCGSITIDLTTGDYSTRVSKVRPDHTWNVYAVPSNLAGMTPLFGTPYPVSNSRGSFSSRGTITSDGLAAINTQISGGQGVVFVLGNA